jgi:glycosyltransferase involved in cell wall biosynthesis
MAISPLLAQSLSQRSGRHAHSLRLPWSVPPPIEAQERRHARHTLALATEDEVVLYAGNLDAYQGLAVLTESARSLACERPRLRLLLATQASAREVAALGVPAERLRHMALANEADRRRAHAAADVVAVPRASPGGLPVKLLDALARGVPVVAARRAAAGLALEAACTLVEDDNPHAFARALAASLNTIDRTALVSARAYILSEHSNAAFLADFGAGLAYANGECAAPARSFAEPLARGDSVP